jgi:5-methylcytosine-specific restriction endonuclease McrA
MRPAFCLHCKSLDAQFCRKSVNIVDYPRWLCRPCLVLHELLPEQRSRVRRAQARARIEEPPRQFSDYKAFQQAHRKTRRAKQPSTLTCEQWKTVVAFFNGRCAYCDLRDWLFVEHVTPISRGGGTTIDNCLPACKSCNSAKQDRTIEECLSTDLWPHRTMLVLSALAWLQQNGRLKAEQAAEDPGQSVQAQQDHDQRGQGPGKLTDGNT